MKLSLEADITPHVAVIPILQMTPEQDTNYKPQDYFALEH